MQKLTKEELKELTGYTQNSKITKWLVDNSNKIAELGYKYTRMFDAKKTPIVVKK